MKKVITLVLTLTCLLGLTACGEKLEEPPELRIVASDGTVTASKGTFSWQYRLTGGMMRGIESDSVHPLQFEHLEPLTTGDATVKLEFAVEPDSITVAECWRDEHWGNTEAQSETIGLQVVNVTVNVPLKPGGWIYKISAKWDRENYEGTCSYVFYVVQTSTVTTIDC